ncbi:hypothetical protein RF11_05908 [Thelohanellus kitauei]|uniref:Uncharacterized protein n=1 Tax=Thelohanellus kitauei TaxID=669202 RepID=A0A0C2N0A5_THEKT|nr:hypothetical protein RF11_05908 [Thelohanellus kitauei]
MIGGEYVNKLNGMYISFDAGNRIIADIPADIFDQMILEMISLPLPICSIQLDEPTDVENGSQLLMYAKYIHDSVFIDEVIVCKRLETTTMSCKSIKSHGKIFVACEQMVL